MNEIYGIQVLKAKDFLTLVLRLDKETVKQILEQMEKDDKE
jgi:hypothetical protein